MVNPSAGRIPKTLSVIFAAVMAGCFFLPWVKWGQLSVTSKDMATANFYKISKQQFDLESPFPEWDFANNIFWLIPLLSVVSILVVLFQKKFAGLWGATAAALALGLAVVYALFTNELMMFDPAIKLPVALMPAFYLSTLSAIGLIFSCWQKRMGIKLFFILAPLTLSYLAFGQIKNRELTQKVDATKTLQSAYSIPALQLIAAFVTSDSAANATYREKIIEVSGVISELNAKDSTATLSMADSTGSYVIFDFEEDQVAKVKAFNVGDSVTVKGMCSGSIFSEIMGTQTISFKQAIIHN